MTGCDEEILKRASDLARSAEIRNRRNLWSILEQDYDEHLHEYWYC